MCCSISSYLALISCPKLLERCYGVCDPKSAKIFVMPKIVKYPRYSHGTYSTYCVPTAIRENLTRGRWRSRRVLRFGRDEPGANRKSDQARYVVDLQSAHQLQAMRLNCLDADPQQIRDLLCILSFCDQLQYFALPKRELLQLRVGGSSGFSLCRLDVGY